jgi:hypothetical protein
MRLVLVALVLAAGVAHAGPTPVRCDDLATADLAIDGLLDDWPRPALARVGAAPDGAIALRCSWDGTAFAMSLDITDDRVVRVRGAGHEDHVDISIAARGGRAIAVHVLPGTAIAKSKVAAPARVAVADSLQPHGFSVELRVPASQLPGFSPATPSLDVRVVFHDSDAAAGGKEYDLELPVTVELGDRKDLLDDFLRTVRLKRSDIKLDTLAELDPDRRGKERLVAGGTVIGVITDQFAYVSLPATKPADVRSIELVPMGRRGESIVAAVVRQAGNGGTRDLLMLWTVWSGQLQPMAQIEVRKELAGNVLESAWKLVRGPKGAELWVEPKPAVGFTAQSYNEEPAPDSDPIITPWDKRGGIAYAMNGAEVKRRDLPKKKLSPGR